MNVAVCTGKLGDAYFRRSGKARVAKDLDRAIANAELALPHHREEVRIYRPIGRMDQADRAARNVFADEMLLHQSRK